MLATRQTHSGRVSWPQEGREEPYQTTNCHQTSVSKAQKQQNRGNGLHTQDQSGVTRERSPRSNKREQDPDQPPTTSHSVGKYAAVKAKTPSSQFPNMHRSKSRTPMCNTMTRCRLNSTMQQTTFSGDLPADSYQRREHSTPHSMHSEAIPLKSNTARSTG